MGTFGAILGRGLTGTRHGSSGRGPTGRSDRPKAFGEKGEKRNVTFDEGEAEKIAWTGNYLDPFADSSVGPKAPLYPARELATLIAEPNGMSSSLLSLFRHILRPLYIARPSDNGDLKLDEKGIFLNPKGFGKEGFGEPEKGVKTARIFILGSRRSGKTSLLYRWKLGEFLTTVPTVGVLEERFDYVDCSEQEIDGEDGEGAGEGGGGDLESPCLCSKGDCESCSSSWRSSIPLEGRIQAFEPRGRRSGPPQRDRSESRSQTKMKKKIERTQVTVAEVGSDPREFELSVRPESARDYRHHSGAFGANCQPSAIAVNVRGRDYAYPSSCQNAHFPYNNIPDSLHSGAYSVSASPMSPALYQSVNSRGAKGGGALEKVIPRLTLRANGAKYPNCPNYTNYPNDPSGQSGRDREKMVEREDSHDSMYGLGNGVCCACLSCLTCCCRRLWQESRDWLSFTSDLYNSASLNSADAVVYVVDSTSSSSINEMFDDLQLIFHTRRAPPQPSPQYPKASIYSRNDGASATGGHNDDCRSEPKTCFVAILVNKQDAINAVKARDIEQMLNLPQDLKARTLVINASALTGDGIKFALRWLLKKIHAASACTPLRPRR